MSPAGVYLGGGGAQIAAGGLHHRLMVIQELAGQGQPPVRCIHSRSLIECSRIEGRADLLGNALADRLEQLLPCFQWA